jgi:hypothetical protein
MRFVLTAAAMAGAILLPFTNVFGVCAGIITFHIAIYSLRFMKIHEDEGEGEKP